MSGGERLRGRISPAVIALGCLLAALAAGGARGATRWRSLKPSAAPGSVCLSIENQEFDYTRLDREDPVRLSARGPRRLKIISRYLFSPDDAETQEYTLRITLDGQEVLRKTFQAKILRDAVTCSGPEGEVSSLRRATLRLPTGRHELLVFAESAGVGRIAARFFRETQEPKERDTTYAPEVYDGVYHLQFASGTQSTYYHFSSDAPLRFSVGGPANLKIYTRLDFDHTMSGGQNYSLELLRDGQVQNIYHYHTEKLSAAAYVERPDILPGQRKLLRLPIPKGEHRYEIRCVRPEACGIALQIRIPESDIKSIER